MTELTGIIHQAPCYQWKCCLEDSRRRDWQLESCSCCWWSAPGSCPPVSGTERCAESPVVWCLVSRPHQLQEGGIRHDTWHGDGSVWFTLHWTLPFVNTGQMGHWRMVVGVVGIGIYLLDFGGNIAFQGVICQFLAPSVVRQNRLWAIRILASRGLWRCWEHPENTLGTPCTYSVLLTILPDSTDHWWPQSVLAQYLHPPAMARYSWGISWVVLTDILHFLGQFVWRISHHGPAIGKPLRPNTYYSYSQPPGWAETWSRWWRQWRTAVRPNLPSSPESSNMRIFMDIF